MVRKKKLWEDETILGIGRREPHCDFIRTTFAGDRICLNGVWKILYLEAPEYVPERFSDPRFDDSKWDEIEVPSCLERKGYGKEHYDDVWYLFPINPPYVPTKNPTAVYRKAFTVTQKIGGKQWILRFGGAASAFEVWVNGQYIGYSKGSRLSSEFDITGSIHSGENQITVRLFKWSDGSYLECQDMWWFSGIFRTVEILAEPEEGIADWKIDAPYDWESGGGTLIQVFSLKKSESDAIILWSLKDADGITVAEGTADREGKSTTCLTQVHPWSAEIPYLYELDAVLTIDGKAIDSLCETVGFRSIAIRGCQLLFNGKPILINGVNMHDFSPEGGLTVKPEEVEEDLQCMKRCNINAIRCSHYPKENWFYRLCDRYGFYVIDEVDLELHGFEWIQDYTWLNNLPSWEGAYVNRAERMVKEHRNHPCIFLWSLGNESSTGANFEKEAAAIRRLDSTRPIHYEGDPEADIADVYSTMYTRLDGMIRIAEGRDAHDKPHLLCEYAHAMGTGPGNLEKYQTLFRKYDRLHGGLVWEWYDEALAEKGTDGSTVYRYGGDYGDIPNNGNFCVDGLLMPDRTPSSGLLHLKQVIAPIRARIDETKPFLAVVIQNDLLFRSLSYLELDYEVSSEGKSVLTGTAQLPIPPGMKASIRIPAERAPLKAGDSFVNLHFRYREATAFSETGYEMALIQLPIPAMMCSSTSGGDSAADRLEEKRTERMDQNAVLVTEAGHELILSAENCTVVFNTVTGELERAKSGESPILLSGPRLVMDRPVIDNDMYKAPDWYGKYFLQCCEEDLEAFAWRSVEDGVRISVDTVFAPVSQCFGFRAAYRYLFRRDGTLTLNLALYGYHHSSFYPEFIPRIGIEMQLPDEFRKVTWYGRGPIENYPDMRAGATIGIWARSVEEMAEGYIKPQENGHRCDTRWIALSDRNHGWRELIVASEPPIGFDARDCSIPDLSGAAHREEIPHRDRIYLHLDAMHTGLGTNSCGEEQTWENKTRLNDYHMRIALSMKGSKETEIEVLSRCQKALRGFQKNED